MSERVYKLLNGYTLLVSEEYLGAVSPSGMKTTVESDDVIDDVLALVDVGNEAARELEYAKKQAGIWNDEAVRLRKELEEAQKQSTKWEKAFDNADKQYLKKEQEEAALRRRLNTTEYGLNCITMGEWECTHDHQGLEVWTTRRINPGQIARGALAVGQEGEGNQE